MRARTVRRELRNHGINGCKQVVAFGAVNGGEKLGCECRGRSVINDLARLEGYRARAISQRIFDLMKGNEDSDAVLAVEIREDVHDPACGVGIERGDWFVGHDELRAL